MFPAKVPIVSQPPSAITSFITQWTVSGDETARTVTIPFVDDDNSISFIIDWGDSGSDTVSAFDDDLGEGGIDHIYAGNGTYTVTMTGTISGIQFNNGGDKTKLVKITNWGTYIMSMDKAFYGCENLTITATDAPTVNLKTTANGLRFCFAGCEDITGIGDTSGWDLTSAGSLDSTFLNCTDFNADLSKWAVSSSNTSMASTFNGCENFNASLNGWDFSNVTSAESAFEDTLVFQNGSVAPNWDLSKNASFSLMFKNSGFNQSIASTTGWGTATGASAAFNSMFENNTAFNQSLATLVVTNMNTAGGKMMVSMFAGSGVAMTTDNYNATLIAWFGVNATDNITFDAGESVFSSTERYAGGGTTESGTTGTALVDTTQSYSSTYDAGSIAYNKSTKAVTRVSAAGLPSQPSANHLLLETSGLFAVGVDYTLLNGAAARARWYLQDQDTWTITDGGATVP